MVTQNELRKWAEKAIDVLHGADQEADETHEMLCAMGDSYNASLADGDDKSVIKGKRAKFKKKRKEWLLNRHAANVLAGCKQILELLDELGE